MTWFNTSYLYKKSITIDHTKVSGGSNLSSFPVLISNTDANLKTVANSGHVQNSSGFDIIFTDSTETTKLDHEIESYTATTGAIVMWVRVPTLSASVDTVVYMYYGNSGISTSQENVTGVWDTNFAAVWHLGAATGSNQTDSTSNARTGTAVAPNPTQATGKIDGSLTNTTGGISVSSAPALGSAFTLECWLNPASPITINGLFFSEYNNDGKWFWRTDPSSSSGNFEFFNGTSTTTTTGGPLVASTWQHVAVSYDGSIYRIYYNGAVNVSSAASQPAPANGTTLGLGKAPGGFAWAGGMDEARISSATRTTGWIATSYNSQNSPSTFYTVGSELVSAVTKTTNVRTRLSVQVTKSVGVRFVERVQATKSVGVRVRERVQATKSAGVRFLERVQVTKSVGVRLRERVQKTATAPLRFVYQTVSTTKSIGVRLRERVQKTGSTPVRFLERVQKTVSVPVRFLERVQITKSVGVRLRENVQATKTAGMRLRYQTIAFTKTAGVRFLERVSKSVSAPLRARIATQKTLSTPARTRIRVTNTANLPVRFRYQTIPFTKSVGARLRENVKRTLSTGLRTRITTTVTALLPVRFLLIAGTIAKKSFNVRLRLNVAQSLSLGMRFLYRTVFDMLKVKAWDTFHRPDQSGWGTASDGTDIWSFAGAAYTASIVSNEGKLTGTTGIGVGILGSNTIADGAALIGLNAVNSTSDEVGAVLRYTDINNFYYAKATGGHLYLAQMVGGTPTNLTNSIITQNTNTSYWLRFYVAGNKLRARWWSKDVAEPGSWMLVTSSSLTGAHQYGVYYNAAVTTNSVLFDNFEVDFSTRVMSAPVRLVLQVAASVTAPIRTLLSVGKTLTTPLRTRLRVTATRSAPVRLRYQTIAFTRYVGVRFLERVQRSAVAPVRVRLTTLVTKSIATRLLLRVGRTFSAPVRARLQVRATASSPIRGRVRVLNTVIVPIRFIYQTVSTTKSFGVRLRERVTATVVAPLRARIRQLASRTAPLRTRLSVGQSKSTQMRTVLRAQNTRVAQVRGRVSIRATVSLPIRFIYQTVHTTLWSPVRVRLRAQRTGTTALRLHLIFSQVRALGIRSKISVQKTPVAPMRFVLYVPPTNAIFRVRKGLMYLKVREP